VHDGTYSVTTPSGKTLTGCDVCHGYYEGERGAQVQFAISVANDTRCTACHAEYHTAPRRRTPQTTARASMAVGSATGPPGSRWT